MVRVTKTGHDELECSVANIIELRCPEPGAHLHSFVSLWRCLVSSFILFSHFSVNFVCLSLFWNGITPISAKQWLPMRYSGDVKDGSNIFFILPMAGGSSRSTKMRVHDNSSHANDEKSPEISKVAWLSICLDQCEMREHTVNGNSHYFCVQFSQTLHSGYLMNPWWKNNFYLNIWCFILN